MSAVFGNSIASLFIDALDGVFNSSFNSAWNASGLNPRSSLPSQNWRPTRTPPSGWRGQHPVQALQMPQTPLLLRTQNQEISPFFLTEGATSVLSNTVVGSSWYVLNTSENGYPQDGNTRVLIMQVTTTGSISGQLNYQVFPDGVGQNAVRLSTSFEGPGTYQGGFVDYVEGCMQNGACNYDPCANLSPSGSAPTPMKMGIVIDLH